MRAQMSKVLLTTAFALLVYIAFVILVVPALLPRGPTAGLRAPTAPLPALPVNVEYVG